MSVFEIDESGDLVRELGAFVRLPEGYEEIAQGGVVALRLERGEVLTDQSRGVLYSGLVLEKGTPPSRIEGELVDQLLRVPGMAQVFDCDVTVDRATRHATATISAEGSLGDLRARIPIDLQVTLDLGED